MATTPKQRGRPFPPKTSGNLSGRPRGSKNKVTVAVESLMETEALEITATAIALAKAGDMRAIESVLSRIAPAPRDRRLSLPNLPACDTAEGIATAQAMLIAEVAGGNLRPSEASALADLLELRRRSLETSTLEERIVALETKAKGNPL